MSKTKKTAQRKQAERKRPAKAKTAATVKRMATTKSASKRPANASRKIAVVVALLRRSNGASIEEIMSATGWQAHSVRGAISGAIKKKLGVVVTSEKTAGKRFYRIADTASV